MKPNVNKNTTLKADLLMPCSFFRHLQISHHNFAEWMVFFLVLCTFVSWFHLTRKDSTQSKVHQIPSIRCISTSSPSKKNAKVNNRFEIHAFDGCLSLQINWTHIISKGTVFVTGPKNAIWRKEKKKKKNQWSVRQKNAIQMDLVWMNRTSEGGGV